MIIFRISAIALSVALLGGLTPSASVAALALPSSVPPPPTVFEFGDDTVSVPEAFHVQEKSPSAGISDTISPVAHTINVAVVTPAGTSAPTVTDAQIDARVATLSGYWVDQTNGMISSITRLGSISRYASSYDCSQVSSGIWTEAASKFGKTKSSYYSPAQHLLVIGPQNCGSAGLGSRPSPSLTNGGLLWTQDIGPYTDIITHEFGHNLGLNHANAYVCTGNVNAQDTRGTGQVCPTREYYDSPDVMGAAWVIGNSVSDVSTSLNSINRENLGTLKAGEQTVVSLFGTSNTYSKIDYTLTDAGLRNGQRSLKVLDPQSGTNYYVEFRNGNGSDSKSLFGKGLTALTTPAGKKGVRVLARAGSATLNFMTTDREDLRPQGIVPIGQTFTSDSGLLTVTPVSNGASTAVVSIEMKSADYKPLVLSSAPVPTVSGKAVVGQTLTASAGSWTPAPVAVSYQWLRDGVSISGAVGASYGLVAADRDAVVSVAVTGAKPGYVTQTKTSSPTSVILTAVPMIRTSGADRFSTSAAISRAAFAPGVPVVYIANGSNFPDALSAAPVAGRSGAPVLLVPADGIPAVIQAELSRLKPGRVVVLGGVNAVFETVKTALTRFTPGTVTRTSGADRFSTSAAISRAAFAPGVPVVYIANGSNFPDALSAAPVAGRSGAPVLLVPADGIPAVIQAELLRLKPGRVVVLGGVNAVSETVKAALTGFTPGTVTRTSGADRFSTSAAISRAAFAPGVPVVYIANGSNFPDALSAAPVAGRSGAPVLLVPADGIPAVIQAELSRLKPGRVIVLGGVNAVSDRVAQQLASYVP